jgi:hypothetical protein
MLSALQMAVEQFDLESYVRDHGGDEVQTGEWALVCPRCQKPKLIVSIEHKSWHCWVCERYETVWTTAGPRRRAMAGAGGLVDLVELLDSVSRDRAIAFLISATKYLPHELGNIPVRELRQRGMAAVRRAVAIPYPVGAQPILDYSAVPYLRERGITWEDVQAFGLFVCTSGRYAGRLVFPVFEGGMLIYYQARAMWSPTPGEKYVKTLNPPAEDCGVVSSDVLMNLDSAARHLRVAIVEGPVDCVHAGPSAVCTFGKKISPTQIGRLLFAGVRAVDLMWDADAWADMQAAAPMLASLFDVRLVRLPSGDPGQRSRGELNRLRAQGIPYGHRTLCMEAI